MNDRNVTRLSRAMVRRRPLLAEAVAAVADVEDRALEIVLAPDLDIPFGGTFWTNRMSFPGREGVARYCLSLHLPDGMPEEGAIARFRLLALFSAAALPRPLVPRSMRRWRDAVIVALRTAAG